MYVIPDKIHSITTQRGPSSCCEDHSRVKEGLIIFNNSNSGVKNLIHKCRSINIKGLSCIRHKFDNGMSIVVATNGISFARNKIRMTILCFQK